MNRIFRLVWIPNLGCYVVASELARSRIKTSTTGAVKSTAILSLLISFGMSWPSLSIADTVSANTETQVYDSPNGVPVVDIATANANGLSHNKFSKYNVDSIGLVLNNNAGPGLTAVSSQLAGQVQVNPNLNNAAGVILSEVVSANRSTLAGYTEVAGAKADVIVANPWGITCSGCGYINTDRVTLSTGTPVFNNDNFTGFDVKQGDVLVNGTGADLSAQKVFDIVARSIKLDGQVNADDLKLIAGSNEWDYSSRTSTTTTPTGTTPAYAIDSTMLGGMYAGRVELIANAAGVGVRMLGDAAASVGSFTLTADGKIELNNQVSAEQNIALISTDNTGDAITLTDTSLTAKQNIEFTANSGGATIAGGAFKASGTLSYQLATLDDVATASSVDDNNKRYASTVVINTTAAANIDAVSYGAASSLDINADSLDLWTRSTVLYTDIGPLAINVTADMALGNASVKSANGMTLSSISGLITAGSAPNQGIQSTAGDITITIGAGLDNKGVISADTGALTIVSQTPGTKKLNNIGTLYGKSAIKLGDIGNWFSTINNSGQILSDDTLNISAGVINNTAGAIQGLGTATIHADYLNNNALLFASNTSGTITAAFIENQSDGVIQSGDDLTIESYLLENANKLLATGDLSITRYGYNAGTFKNVGKGIVKAGEVLNFIGLDTLDVADGTSLLGDSLQVDVAELTNLGTVQSVGNLALNIGTSLTNSQNIVSTQGDVTVRGTDADYVLNNTGSLEAIMGLIDIKGQNDGKGASVSNASVIKGNTLQITADTLTVAGGAQIESAGAMLLDLNTLVMSASDSVILGGGSSFINLTVDLDNYGKIHSTDDLSLSTNSSSFFRDIKNQSGAAISALKNLTISSDAFTNSATVYAGKKFVANITKVFINDASGEINSSGIIEITAGDQFTNNHEIVAAENITISSRKFNNEIDGGDTRVLGDAVLTSTSDSNWLETCGGVDVNFNPSSFNCLGVDQFRTYSRSWTITQEYKGLSPTNKNRPQILSTGGNITIGDFSVGLNLGGIISAIDLTLNPKSGNSKFTNDDYSLRKSKRTETWRDELKWSGVYPYKKTFDINDLGDPATDRYYYGAAINSDLYGGVSTVQTFFQTLSSAGLYASGTLSTERPEEPGLKLINVSGLNSTGSATTEDVTASTDPAAVDQTSTINGSAIPASDAISFGGLSLTLPTSPNGFFVQSQNPSSGYLVETNPLYQVGSTFGGSDFFINRYGYDPELLQKRLGDAGYEAYLIRQQLITQTGNNMLDGYQQEEVLLQSLMEQGADESTRLGFVFGESPTKEQLTNLDSDIVWMVEVTVNGEKVLAPQVFLSQATKDKILTGAVIAAEIIDLEVESLSNRGGVIVANEDLKVKAVNDITNTSGTIKGGDVSLTSTDGSIINQTWSQTTGGEGNTVTNIGKTGSIESTGGLSLTAKEDIKISGANLIAEGNGSLSAGNDIVIDTIVDKNSNRTSNNTDSTSSTTTTTTTTTTETNIGSTVTLGGNLSVSSGNDTTIAGSAVSVDGDLNAEAGGDFNVIARQDKVTTNTVESKAGFGEGGGFIGSEKTTTDKFSGTNVGSSLAVGGNASIDSEEKFVIQGSDVDIAGNADIDAASGIEILDGLDVETSTTVTETFTLLKIEGDAESGTASDSSSSTEYLAVDAGASANASAESNHDLILEQATTTTTNSGSNTSVASNLNIGGNLTATTKGDLTLQGSNVAVGGNATLDAENVNVLTGRNETWSDTTTTSTTVGLFEESTANANSGAGADAQAYGALATNAAASATANASAGTDATLGVRVEQENSSDYSLTNSGSSIGTGGDLSITAKNTATFVGANVESGGDMSIDATDINNLAARDITESTTSGNSDTAGVYVSGDASAQASAESNAQTGVVTNADGSLSASAEAEAGAGVRYNNKTSSTTDGTSTVVGNNFKSGGNFSRTAEDTIVDQATQVDAGGDIDQSARVIRDEAVHNETYSSSETSEDDARIGVYAGAKVDAGADAGGFSGGSADAGAEASAGVQAQYENENTSSSSEIKTAVTSKFKSGGNINSNSEESTTLVGTQFESAGDVNIEAGSLDYQAAQDSTSSTSSSSEVLVDGKVAIYGSPGVKLDAEYGGGDSSESTTTARAGSISAGGNLNIKTKGDATFVGTNLEAGDQASIDAGGDVDFQAARNTTSSSSDSTDANVSLSATKQDKSMGVGGGYEQSDGESSTAVVGSIKSGNGGTSIKSGGDSSFEGTQLASDGAISVDAGGDVNLMAAKSTSSDVNAGASGEIGMGAEGSPEGVVDGGFTDVGSTDSTTTSIQSGGDISIKGATINSQEADIQSMTGTETMIGEVVNTEAENSEYATGVEVRLKGGGGDSSKKNGGTDSSPTRPRSDAASDSASNKSVSSDPVSRLNDSTTSTPDAPLVKDSTATNPNPNDAGADDAKTDESTNPNPNDAGADDAKTDESTNPNPNDAGADDAKTDESTNPNPNDAGADDAKTDESTNLNPNDADSDDIKEDDSTNPNPNDADSDDIKEDDSTNPNPNDAGADDAKEDDSTNPNPNEAGTDDAKEDESTNPNPNDAVVDDAKEDESTNPNPNDADADDAKEDDSTNPNPNDADSEDAKEDESTNLNPNDADSDDIKEDDSTNPNPNDAGADDAKEDDSTNPNPNEAGTDDAKEDESTNPNPNDAVVDDAKEDESTNPNPNDADADDAKEDDSTNLNPNDADSDDIKEDDSTNPNPNDADSDDGKEDESTNPNPNDADADDAKEDDSTNPNPNDADADDAKEDDSTNPNPNDADSEDAKEDESTNLNPNDAGADDAKEDDSTNPNPNDAGADDAKEDDSTNPNPNDADSEDAKEDDSTNPNPNDADSDDGKEDESTNPNPNEADAEDIKEDDSTNLNPNDAGADDAKEDDSTNPNPNDAGADDAKEDDSTNPNPNEAGTDDAKEDESTNPNPNDADSDDGKEDESTNPNPNEAGTDDAKEDESTNPNPNDADADDAKEDDSTNLNPNDADSDDIKEDDSTNPNPNDADSDDGKEDESTNPNPNDADADDAKEDDSTNPNPNDADADDAKEDDSTNPNPNDADSEDAKEDESTNLNPNDAGADDAKEDDSTNPNPNDAGADDAKEDDSTNPNPNDADSEDAKEDDSTNPNPNDADSDDGKEDESTNPNPNEADAEDIKEDDSTNLNPNDAGADDAKEDDSTNPNPNDAGADDAKEDDSTNPNPNEAGTDDAKEDESTNPNPNDADSDDGKEDESTNPNPNEAGTDDAKEDESTNPNPNDADAEDAKEDESKAGVVDGNSLRAKNRVSKTNNLTKKTCVDVEVSPGKIECVFP
ncbi:MAG: filamentous hemagglutinin [Zhongshania sp.]|jgi:filamentous hemagglutinin